MTRTAYLYPLQDIDGSLASLKLAHVRLPTKRQHSFPSCSKRSLVLVSCTTISVYVNLSKNVPQPGRNRVSTVPDGAVSPHLRVQRYAFSRNWQNFHALFSEKDVFLPPIHYILYTRERKTSSSERKKSKNGRKSWEAIKNYNTKNKGKGCQT